MSDFRYDVRARNEHEDVFVAQYATADEAFDAVDAMNASAEARRLDFVDEAVFYVDRWEE